MTPVQQPDVIVQEFESAAVETKRLHVKTKHVEYQPCYHYCPTCRGDWSHPVNKMAPLDEWKRTCTNCSH